ncbi:MAG: cobalamin-binding protein [Candidatus Rokubacteria bacterium]|nr:cobalamin-binding protein [Candidatus Rokubacteria bacterium]
MRDATGVALETGTPRRRIVSLIPSTTEILCHFGLADALVGVTAYCREPAAVTRTKTRIGGEKDPDLDRIRALAPDLVIANIEENVAAHVETLRAWGVPVWVTYPRTVDDALVMIRELGEVTGAREPAARLLAEVEPLLAHVRATLASRPPVPVFYPIWRTPWMTIGPDTYVHDVLRVCGAANVFGDATARYPEVTLDDVAARRPAVILLPDEPFRFRAVHRRDFEPYRDVPAVRDGRMPLVDGKPFTWHGPRLVEALRTLPALFHPERGPELAAGAA